MRGRTLGKTLAFVLAAALAAGSVPALANDGGGKHGKTPRIQSTTFFTEEEASTSVEAGVIGASKVTLTVGRGDARDRFELQRADREERITWWTTKVPDREEKCAPVVFVAKNSHGTDERKSRVCIFGQAEPEPSSPLPVP